MGGKTALLVTALTLGGCAAGPKQVSIRPIADPAAKIAQGDLAAARGQLVLGNVGLALEAFRKIQRDRPTDPAPLAGIAECYAAMGRLDLADSNYQAALSFAPRDPALLMALAGVYQRQGDLVRAAALKSEAAVASAPAMQPIAGVQADVVQAAAQQPAFSPRNLSSSVTVELPPARTVASFASVATDVPALANEEQAAAPSSSITVPLPPARPARPMQVAALTSEVRLPELAEATRFASTVTVPLPPAIPASPPAPRPQAPAATQAAVASEIQPRLQRLSRGEVALVTTGRPMWRAGAAPAKLAMAQVQWIPLRDSTASPNVQILNAARRQGLAGSARTVLLDRGWRKIAVGDAASTRETSVIFYPASRAKLARNLAAQFGIAARQVRGDQLVLVLGRDAVGLVGTQRRS